MAIIRVTKKQIQEANKAREAALKKNDDFRRYEEQRQHANVLFLSSRRFEKIVSALLAPDVFRCRLTMSQNRMRLIMRFQ